MRNVLISVAALAIATASSAIAGPVVLAVTVDTSSLAGTVGSLDLNFNPGPTSSQAAYLTVSDFIAGTLAGGCPCGLGNVIGELPPGLTFDNGAALNDYFEGLTFGSLLSFNLNFSGPALVAPDGTSVSGSTFAFSLFSDAAGTTPALTTDTLNGFAFTVDVNLDGGTSVTNNSSQTSIETLTPEPATLLLSGLALATFALVRRARGSASL